MRYFNVGLTSPRNPTEYMKIEDTYSPVLHRIDQAVRWRAVHPNEPIPAPYDILIKYSNPPAELVNKSKRRLEKLVAAADVKKGNYTNDSPYFATEANYSP